MVTVVDCPTCGAPVPWSAASRWRPFCSDRCQLIDLGDWAAERHRIAGVAIEPESAEESLGERPAGMSGLDS